MAEKKFNWEILSLSRFILASIVMLVHLKEFTKIGFLNWFTFLGAFEAIFGFLLISGLSIGKSIQRNKESYFERRIKRIYPVYLASVVFQYVVLPSTLNLSFIGFIFLNLVFLNQVFTSTSYVGPSWTLALEVWLYSLAPFFLKLSIRQLYILIYLSFISYCFYTCGRTLYHWNYYSGTHYGINLILLSFIWIAGFALAIFPSQKKSIAINIALILLCHIILTILIQVLFRYKHHELGKVLSEDIFHFFGQFCCLAFSYCVVIFNHKMPFFSITTQKIFNLLGNISYPLYLVHFTVFALLAKWHIHNVPIMIFSALLFSFLIYWMFDFYSKKRVAKHVISTKEITHL